MQSSRGKGVYPATSNENEKRDKGTNDKSHLSMRPVSTGEQQVNVRTLTSSAHDLKNAAGLSTCSMTSIEKIISNQFGSDTRVSADAWWNDSVARPGSVAVCRVVMPILSADASMERVFGPRRARLWAHSQS